MSRRVLLVDDNNAVRTQLKGLIQSEGYEVVEAKDGLDGLTKAKNSLFDAFVIDYKMPIMDGVTLIKGLKDMPSYCDHLMVLLTTDDGAEFSSKIAKIENIDVLCKPINQSHLINLLQQQTSFVSALSA